MELDIDSKVVSYCLSENSLVIDQLFPGEHLFFINIR